MHNTKTNGEKKKNLCFAMERECENVYQNIADSESRFKLHLNDI